MPIWTNTPDKPIQFTFLLFDQFSNNSLGNCLEPLRACNAFATTPVFEWQFLTIDGRPVHSSSGLQILPEGPLSALKRCDYLLVNASYGYTDHNTAKTRSALRKAARLADTVVGLDTGPWLLAAAELLDDKRATVHWDIFGEFAETFPMVQTERQRVIEDGNRITCAGAIASFDLSLSLISKHLGDSFKVDIEAYFMHQDPPLAAQSFKGDTRDPLVRRALDLMYAHLEAPLSRREIAQHLSCQEKTLDRRCLKTLGATAGQIYRHIRLSAAQQMATSSSLSVIDIALRCGFQNPSALTRAYKARFGVSPTQSRMLARAK